MTDRLPVATPEEAKQSGKLVVLAFANIHAGEVDGKEALLAIARDLTTFLTEYQREMVAYPLTLHAAGLPAADFGCDAPDGCNEVLVRSRPDISCQSDSDSLPIARASLGQSESARNPSTATGRNGSAGCRTSTGTCRARSAESGGLACGALPAAGTRRQVATCNVTTSRTSRTRRVWRSRRGGINPALTRRVRARGSSPRRGQEAGARRSSPARIGT